MQLLIVCVDVVITSQTLWFPSQHARVLFSIRVVAGSVFYSYLCPQDVRPLHHPAVDRYHHPQTSCLTPDLSECRT